MSDIDAKQTESASLIGRAARNFGKLFRGQSVAAVLELLSVGLLARTLTPVYLGHIVLIQSYVLIIRGLLNFKLFEVIVRFGVPLLEADNEQGFKQLLRLTLLIDFLTSVISTAVAVAAAPLIGRILGWDGQLVSTTMVYSIVLLSFGFGTAKGVLRLFDRHDVLGNQLMLGPVLRLSGVLVVMALNPTVFAFAMSLLFATATGNIYLIVRGWVELRHQVGRIGVKGPSLRTWRGQFPGLDKFLVIVYWQANVDLLPKQISILLAGTFLGPAGAGLLRLARETTKVLSKPGALVRQVLFPDMVRMWVRGAEAFGFLLARAMLFSALFGVVFVTASLFGGAQLLGGALGADYAAAAPLMSLLLLAATLELLASVLRSAGYAMGHAGKILKLHIFSAVLYLTAFAALTPYYGLLGPGFAAIAAATVPLAGIGMLVVSGIRRQRVALDNADA